MAGLGGDARQPGPDVGIGRERQVAFLGDVVAIHCLGFISPVVIRRIDLDLYPGESFYGVELTDGAQPLADELRRQFLDTNPSSPLEFQPRR